MEFEEIYTTYWPRIFRLCMGYVNDHELARDLTQETFIIVWQQLPRFRNESAIGTWIYRIASNNCLRQIEKEKQRGTTALPDHLPEEQSHNVEPQLRLLYTFLSELPELDRILISLELEAIPQAEIAAITGLSEGNVRVRLHRIKKLLTQKFRDDERRS